MTYFSAGAMKARYPGNFSPFCSETQYQSEVLDSTCKEKKKLDKLWFQGSNYIINCQKSGFRRKSVVLILVKIKQFIVLIMRTYVLGIAGQV